MRMPHKFFRIGTLLGISAMTVMTATPSASAQNQDFTGEALRLIQAKQWPQAKAFVLEALNKMPDSWTPVERKADGRGGESTIVHVWDSDEFIAFSKSGISGTTGWLRPSYSQGYYLLGFIEEEQGNYGEALKALDRALELEPDHPTVIAEKAYVYQRQKKFAEAIEFYKKAQSSRTWATKLQLAHALRGEGYCLVELGRLDEAEAAYRKALELDPGNRVTISELSFIQRQRTK